MKHVKDNSRLYFKCFSKILKKNEEGNEKYIKKYSVEINYRIYYNRTLIIKY